MKLTQEQLAKLIAKVFSNLTAKFAEAGKNVNDITADDILAELSAVLEEMNAGEGEGAPAGDGEGKGEGEGTPAGEGEGEGDAEGKGFDGDELIGKIMEALSGVLATGDEGKSGCGDGKSATGPSAPKAAPQRKYASLFLSTGASRDGKRRQRLQGPHRIHVCPRAPQGCLRYVWSRCEVHPCFRWRH